MQKNAPDLPITHIMPSLKAALSCCHQMILKAETGAGKSTYLPLDLLLNSTLNGQIVLMEPRRLAAKTIAHYLAKQLGEAVGQRVGYQIRGEQKRSKDTQLLIVTEGIMTAMIQGDPELNGIDLVIFDEFHERSIHADTSLAFCLESQAVFRNDLKILIMSATLEKESLQSLLPDAQYFDCPGRSYPVDIQHRSIKPNQNLEQAVVAQSLQIMREQTGSLLVFLDSRKTIRYVQSQLESQLSNDLFFSNVELCPLYGQLDLKAQQQAIQAPRLGQRKIVLATNIAETSLTIEGIQMVLDAGMEQFAHFDLKTGTTKLERRRIAQSAAIQRTGRAGRLCAGLCVRLYSKDIFERQPKETLPEILRSDLSSLMLETLKWGAQDIFELNWLTKPPQPALDKACHLLTHLGLVSKSDKKNSRLNLNADVRYFSSMSLDARFLGMLIQAKQLAEVSHDHHVLNTAFALIPLLEQSDQNQDLMQSLHRLQINDPQYMSYFKRSQNLAKLAQLSFDVTKLNLNYAGLLVAFAYPDRIAYRQSNQNSQYLLSQGHGAYLDPQSPLAKHSWIVAVDLLRHQGSKQNTQELNQQQGRSQIFRGIAFDLQLAQQYAKQHKQDPKMVCHTWFNEEERVVWDPNKGQLQAWHLFTLGSIILDKSVRSNLTSQQVTEGLIDYIRREGLKVLPWKSTAVNFRQRVLCAALWLPEESWPDFSEQALLASLEDWLAPYLLNMKQVKDLQRIDLYSALSAYLSWPLNQNIDEWLPKTWQLPTGRAQVIRYQEGLDPVLSIKMQEIFGQKQTPLIAKGRQAILIEMLSPAMRPLQLTKDLAGFWQGSYVEVQKEMKGRYPKHIWPDDPANHQATQKTKRGYQNQVMKK